MSKFKDKFNDMFGSGIPTEDKKAILLEYKKYIFKQMIQHIDTDAIENGVWVKDDIGILNAINWGLKILAEEEKESNDRHKDGKI